jgi:hypothetical protein
MEVCACCEDVFVWSGIFDRYCSAWVVLTVEDAYRKRGAKDEMSDVLKEGLLKKIYDVKDPSVQKSFYQLMHTIANYMESGTALAMALT